MPRCGQPPVHRRRGAGPGRRDRRVSQSNGPLICAMQRCAGAGSRNDYRRLRRAHRLRWRVPCLVVSSVPSMAMDSVPEPAGLVLRTTVDSRWGGEPGRDHPAQRRFSSRWEPPGIVEPGVGVDSQAGRRGSRRRMRRVHRRVDSAWAKSFRIHDAVRLFLRPSPSPLASPAASARTHR